MVEGDKGIETHYYLWLAVRGWTEKSRLGL